MKLVHLIPGWVTLSCRPCSDEQKILSSVVKLKVVDSLD
jgi:hypothetical protein